jgi:integrase
MKPYKACSCRDPETGRLLGKKCPDLGKRDHGKWYARYEAPKTADGKRRQPRIGPYDREKDCKDALVKALGQVGQTGRDTDRKMTVATWLDKRLGWRESAAETNEGLKASTLAAEREAITLYLKPGIGHIKLVDLRDEHIRDLYATMRKLNRPGKDVAPPSELMRRLLAVRGSGHQAGRPLSEARVRRVHAVLNGALNDAVKLSKLIPLNPATGIFRTKGGAGRKGRAKPLLWTAERVEQWEKTGKVPARVMVWTSAQCGAFLDFAEHDRMYPLLHFAAYWGLRRGELVGLEWPDLSLDRRRLHVRQAQVAGQLDDAKSEDSDRNIVFDEDTAKVGRKWRQAQTEERVKWGRAWTDSGRVFTYEDGTALRPGYVSAHFTRLVRRYSGIRRRHADGWSRAKIVGRLKVTEHEVSVALAGPPLPPVRLHDLRHGAATMLLAAGVDIKVISEVLGHATTAFTSDVYAVVAEELAEDAATKIAAFVPRRNRA